MFNYPDSLYSQLKGFYFTAVFKSVSLAADALGLTQPAVSQQLKALQKTLGKSFFFRKNNKMQLTHDGKQLFKDVKKLIEKMDNIYNTQTQVYTDRSIHIVGTQGSLNYVLPKVIREYKALYPDVELIIEYSDTYGKHKSGVEMIESGADLFFCSHYTELPDHCKFTTLETFPVFLMAHPEHPIAKLDTIQLKDIFSHELVIVLDTSQTKGKFQEAYQHYQSKLSINYSDLLNLQKTFVKEGVAITIGSCVILDENDTELFTYSMDHYFRPAKYGFVTLENEVVPPHVQQFIDVAHKYSGFQLNLPN